MPQSISAEPLAQMVRSITLQKRTGVLRVEQLGGKGAEQGEIYFENGSLVRARTERKAGKAALLYISEWKQITCSFHNMNRRYPATTPLTTSPFQEAGVAHSQISAPSASERPAPRSEERDTEPRGNVVLSPVMSGERHTHTLHPRLTESVLSANASSPMLAASQPLILHGTQLEVYEPVPPVSSPRAVQRWTTHLGTGTQLPAPSPAASPLPRPASTTSEEVRPGRMAVFKSRAQIPVAQAIQQMERRARIVFILLDGRRTIQDIARLTHQAEYEVEQILIDLTKRGYTHYLCG